MLDLFFPSKATNFARPNKKFMKPTLLILAAGMGSRYGGLKQMDTIGPSGEGIIDYSIYDAIRSGFGKVVFIIRKDIDADFKKYVGKKYEGKIPVEYVYQELENIPANANVNPERTKPWGTGHAVLMAADAIKEPFAVINADDFYGRASFLLLSGFLSALSQDSTTHCIVGYRLANTLSDFGHVSRGVCRIDDHQNLQGVTERTHIAKVDGQIYYQENQQGFPLTGSETVSMNMMGFSPSIFTYFKEYFEEFIAERGQELKSEFYLPYVVNRVIQEGLGEVRVLTSEEKWFGVTYREDKDFAVSRVSDLIQKGIYPSSLWG